MQADELLKAGKLDEALDALQQRVRKDPADAKARVFLFQLLCVMGNWERALTQLNVAAEMDAENLLMAEVCRQAIAAELLRADIFAGKRPPHIFGQPGEWVAWMVQANQLTAEGKHAEASELRAKALEASPAIGGTINGTRFEWLADADARLGPILDVIMQGRYMWVPLQNVREIKIDPPTDLRDMVWLPATFTWTNGGSAVALIPTRYPGSEHSPDGAVRLARKTDWKPLGTGDEATGLGQRLLASDAEDFPLLEVREVKFDFDEAAAAQAADPLSLGLNRSGAPSGEVGNG